MVLTLGDLGASRAQGIRVHRIFPLGDRHLDQVLLTLGRKRLGGGERRGDARFQAVEGLDFHCLAFVVGCICSSWWMRKIRGAWWAGLSCAAFVMYCYHSPCCCAAVRAVASCCLWTVILTSIPLSSIVELCHNNFGCAHTRRVGQKLLGTLVGVCCPRVTSLGGLFPLDGMRPLH